MPSGFTWSTRDLEWKQTYVDLPVYEDKKLLLVPKHTVRFEIGVDHSQYRSRKVVGRVSELSRRLVMGWQKALPPRLAE